MQPQAPGWPQLPLLLLIQSQGVDVLAPGGRFVCPDRRPSTSTFVAPETRKIGWTSVVYVQAVRTKVVGLVASGVTCSAIQLYVQCKDGVRVGPQQSSHQFPE